MKVVFGGSFNPPTIAHSQIIKYLSSHFDEVIIMPNANNYKKPDLIDFMHRKKMIELITSDYQNVFVSDLENRRGFQGTFQMLRDLGHPYFACGEDCLEQFVNWINPICLLSENKFIIFTRNSSLEKMEKIIEDSSFLNRYKSHFEFAQIDFQSVSSSMFRRTHDEAMVDKKVRNYIEENDLYKKDLILNR